MNMNAQSQPRTRPEVMRELTDLVIPGRLTRRIMSAPLKEHEHPALRGLVAATIIAGQTLALPINGLLYGAARLYYRFQDNP